ncbi:MAG: right-handed parallel beta-helix repeat-containing protein, partial [Candidatus Aenigmatarchaeota archaeon]
SGTPDQKFDLSVLKENLTVFSFLGQTNSSGLSEIYFKLFEKGNYSAILKYEGKEEVVSFEVLERIENVTEEILTRNITLTVVSLEQGKAEINKPVKWKKVLRVINPIEKEVEVDFKLELPENSFNITLEERENKIKLEEKRLKDKLKAKESKEYILTYYTEAPHAYEEVLDKYKKIVKVNSSLHYENVLAYTEVEKSPRNSVRLYWLVNSERIDVTLNESFKVKLLDLDNDNLIERVEWIIPYLSEQTFEISITILNPYTYLRDGETWIVAFNTTGKADLAISSPNANWKEMLIDNENTFDEMEFLDIKCGENSLKSSLQLIDELNNTYDYSQLKEEDSIRVKKFLIKDYSCDETGYFINKMFRAGYAVLEFEFAGQKVYAYDPDYEYYYPVLNQNFTSNADGWIYGEVDPSNVASGAWASSGGNSDPGVWDNLFDDPDATASYVAEQWINYSFYVDSVPLSASVYAYHKFTTDESFSPGTTAKLMLILPNGSSYTLYQRGPLTSSDTAYVFLGGDASAYFDQTGNYTLKLYAITNSTGKNADKPTVHNYWDDAGVQLTYPTEPPKWFQQSQSTSIPGVGAEVKLSAYWTDNTHLSYAILSTNETGCGPTPCYNKTTLSLSGAHAAWSNFTWQNSSVPGNTVIAWRIYVNDTSNNQNVTDIMTFEVKPTYLLVDWSATSQINSNTCTPSSPCNVVQNSTFNASVNVTCYSEGEGGSCGYVSGSIRYNETGIEPNTLINTTKGATPFYVVAEKEFVYNFMSITSPSATHKAEANTTLTTRPPTELISGTEATTDDYGQINRSDDSRWTSLPTDNYYVAQKFGFKINESVNLIDNITVLWEGYAFSATLQPPNTCIISSTSYCAYLYIWNFSSGSWLFVSSHCVDGDWTLTKSYIRPDYNMSDFVRDSYLYLLVQDNNPTGSPCSGYVSTDYVEAQVMISQNPISCGSLLNGQSCQLNWSINATGDGLPQVRAIDANFSSSLASVQANDTTDAYVKIVSVDTKPPEWSQQFQSTNILGVGGKVNLSTYWIDNVGLDKAILSTNETGCGPTPCYNKTSISLSGTSGWSNFTWQNSSVREGTVIAWRIYVNDTSNNQNVTDIMTFEVKPTYLLVNWKEDSQINSNICKASLPCSIIPNSVFNVSVEVTCYSEGEIEDCGIVKASVRYNESGVEPNKLINTTEDEPFYILMKSSNPVTVANVLDYSSGYGQMFGYGGCRNTFYDGSKFWIFFANLTSGTGGKTLYSYSFDGKNWSSPATLVQIENNILIPCVWFNETTQTVYVSMTSFGLAENVYFIRGTVNNTVINWGNLITAVGGVKYRRGTFPTVDSSGYPWIGYSEYNGSVYRPWVVRASSQDGSTWSSPTLLSDEAGSGYMSPILLPLSNNKMYAIWYSSQDSAYKGKKYDGVSWESTPTIIDNSVVEPGGYQGYYATVVEDRIYFVFTGSDRRIYVRNWTESQGWGDRIVLDDNTTNDAKVTITSDSKGNLFVFWNRSDTIYFKKYSPFYGWDSNASTPFGTSFNIIKVLRSSQFAVDGKVGVAWLENVTSSSNSIPYPIRFSYIDVEPNPITCGILKKGETCQVSWVINATGLAESVWALDANFTSSVEGIPENDTDNAYVKISFCQQYISSCQELDQANTYYCLNQSILDSSSKACINISANNITLDCLGNRIDGTDASNTYGINISRSSSQVTNITVKNCIVTDWYYGIYLYNASKNTIVDSTFNSNAYDGIGIYYSSDNILTNITSYNNYMSGIYLQLSSNNSLNQITSYNNSYGIYLYNRSNFNFFSNITTYNTYSGIAFYISSDNTLTNITAFNNSVGFYFHTSSNNTLSNIILYNNGFSAPPYSGILIAFGSNNTLTNITAFNNSRGIYLLSTLSNNIKSSSFHSNINYDYYLENASSTNNFTQTNFTSARTIYFYDTTSWFNYNNRTDLELWLKTRVSSQATITRKLISWEKSLMVWNDTNSSGTGITARYNISGLNPNKYYLIYNNSVLTYTLQADSFGNLPSFTIYLSSEHEIKVEEDLTPPQYSLNSTNSTIAGSAISHNLFWQDNIGLSYAIFSFDNCTGEFQNISEMSLSGTQAWSNFTVIINETIGCTIRWKVYANDSNNNWNESEIFSYTTTSPSPCQQYISSCSDLTQPNTYYCLNQSILDSSSTVCINISANNIILDCLGNTIDGTDASSTYGINISRSSSQVTNITIKNCIVTDWTYGIYLYQSQNNTLTNNTAISNSYTGILLYSSSNNIIANNTAISNSYYGIYLDSSSNNTLINNTANSNSYGIFLSSSSNNTLINNTANSNSYGIFLSSSSNNTLTNNTANSNSDTGIYLSSSSNNTLFNNQITSYHNSTHKQQGLYIYGTSISHFYHNISESNLINGKPVLYQDSIYRQCT